MGKTSLPKATVRRYRGFTCWRAPRPETMVMADTTQQMVLMRWSLRYSTSFTGSMNSCLGMR